MGLVPSRLVALLQVVRAMERSGEIADKAKYKQLLAELYRREERQRIDTSDVRNVHLERFKFWLGMPNKYFDGEEWDRDRDENRYY